MIIIAVTDDQGGMMFNQRRQSQDRVLRERILALTRDSRLWMNAYTRRQFSDIEEDAAARISADDGFLEKAAPGEFCFVENTASAPYEERTEKIILFRWNRRYPGDFFFDVDVTLPPWKLAETEEFPGFSHEKITMEVYVRE